MEKHFVVLTSAEQLGDIDISVYSNDINLLTLPHPSNQATLCAVIKGTLYELQSAQLSRNSSWFINQRISSSKNVYFLAKLDIRFLLLPFLEKASGKFSPLDQIVFNITGYSNMPIHVVDRALMEDICDVNDKLGDDMLLYRYNAEKTLAWLKGKVCKASSIAQKQRIKRAQSINPAHSTSFHSVQPLPTAASTASDSAGPSEEDVRVALELVADSLTVALGDALFAAHEVQAADVLRKQSTASSKRKADWEVDLEREQEELAAALPKPIVSANQPHAAAAGGVKPPAKVAKGNKANEVAAKGTKNISSFFGGKK